MEVDTQFSSGSPACLFGRTLHLLQINLLLRKQRTIKLD